MKLRTAILAAAFLSLALTGCSKKAADPANDAEAQIRTVIQSRVAGNSNLNAQAFDTVVNSVTINGDRAQAQVDFRLKNGPGAMKLNYQLEKRDGNWVITDSNPIGDSAPHPPVDQTQVPGSGAGIPTQAPAIRSRTRCGASSRRARPIHRPACRPDIPQSASQLPITNLSQRSVFDSSTRPEGSNL